MAQWLSKLQLTQRSQFQFLEPTSEDSHLPVTPVSRDLTSSGLYHKHAYIRVQTYAYNKNKQKSF